MHIRYRVELEESERQQLHTMIAGGTRAVRRVKRAQILLAAADGQSEAAIATTVRVGTSTVYRTKRRFVEESLEAALSEDPRPGGKRKLTGSEEALLIATVCSTPPSGARTLDAGAAGRGGRGADPARTNLTAYDRAAVGGKRPQTVAAKDVVRPED